MTRRGWPATRELQGLGNLAYSRDGGTVYGIAAHRDGRRGVWAIPVAGGEPRLVVRGGDPNLILPGMLSVGPNALYLTTTEWESDIWVADLRW